MNLFNNCQSCGRPIKKAVDRGTKANGTLSGKYCAHCYSMGEFTQPDITAAQMQERVVGKMRELGTPGFLARLLTRNVPRLERWAKPVNSGATVNGVGTWWRPVLAGGLICGVLDINGAFLTAWVNAGMGPVRLLKAVASGLLGAGALEGGAAVAVFGLLLHFCVAFSWTAVFYLLSRRLRFLSDQAVVSGLLYGAFVYLAMNLAVLPLAAQFRSLYIPGTKPFVPHLAWGQFGVHLTCVGLAISLAVRGWSCRTTAGGAAQKNEARPRGPASIPTY